MPVDARLSLYASLFFQGLQFFLELSDLEHEDAPLGFQFRLSRPAGSDTAA